MKMDVILEKLQSLGKVERALADKKYHKSERIHWGVPVPENKTFAKEISQGLSNTEKVRLARSLWETDLFDPMICAAKILTLPKILPTEEVWNTLRTFLTKVDGWALEDQLAHIAWKCILHKESLLNEVETWTKDANFWMRRAALVYTLPYAKPNRNPERMLRWASSYASDKEWFIQKAIGWWLRVLGEHNPQRVILFLNEHGSLLKGVAKKEATRKLSIEPIHFKIVIWSTPKPRD